MDRKTYYRLASILRIERRKLEGTRKHFEMADSVLVIHQSEHNEYVCKVRARIKAIQQSMPLCTDPKGFGKMHYAWLVRRAETMRKVHWRTMQSSHFYAMKKARRAVSDYLRRLQEFA